MTKYRVIKVAGRKHVVTPSEERRLGIPVANYMQTGMALCGVLKPRQTLLDWKLKRMEQIAKMEDYLYGSDRRVIRRYPNRQSTIWRQLDKSKIDTILYSIGTPLFQG